MAVVSDEVVDEAEVIGIAKEAVTEVLVVAGQIITHRAVIGNALMIMADRVTVDITTVNVVVGGRILNNPLNFLFEIFYIYYLHFHIFN